MWYKEIMSGVECRMLKPRVVSVATDVSSPILHLVELLPAGESRRVSGKLAKSWWSLLGKVRVNLGGSSEKCSIQILPQDYRNEFQRPLTSSLAHSPLAKLRQSKVGEIVKFVGVLGSTDGALSTVVNSILGVVGRQRRATGV